MKKFIVLLLILGITVGLSGCSFLGTPSSKIQPGSEKIITVWGVFDDEEVMKPIIENYQQNKAGSNTGVKVVYVKKNYQDYSSESVNAIAAGKGPDVWMIKNDWMPRQYDKLVPAPDSVITIDKYKSFYPDVAINDNIIDNKIYGIPWSVDTLALYYNKDIANKRISELNNSGNTVLAEKLKNPPGNWDDFIEMSKALTVKNGNEIKTAGAALGLSNNVNNSPDILSALMLQNHAQMVSADKKTATFNLPVAKSSGESYYAGTKALEFYNSFANPNKDTYSWNTSMPNSLEAFAQGKVAMMINYGYARQRIFNMAPNLQFDTGPLPQIKDTSSAVDYSSYWTNTVTNNSKNSELAWDFINYVAQKQSYQYSQSTKQPLPTRPMTQDIPAINSRVQKKDNTFIFQLATAQDWYKGQYADKVDELFKQMISNVINGQNPQNAIDTAASNITTLLNKSN